MNSLISVVVPIYNSSTYLQECIHSILAQNYSNIEIILVNDGSLDNSEFICIENQKKYPNKIRYIYQENKGASQARKTGVLAAKGNWIVFIDSDDTVKENYISDLAQFAEENTIVVSALRENQYTYKIKDTLSQKEFLKLLLSTKIHHGPYNKLIPKKFFNDFVFDIPASIKSGEDLIMNLRLLLQIEKFKYIPHLNYNYRILETSITHNYTYNFSHYFKLKNEINRSFSHYGIKKYFFIVKLHILKFLYRTIKKEIKRFLKRILYSQKPNYRGIEKHKNT